MNNGSLNNLGPIEEGLLTNIFGPNDNVDTTEAMREAEPSDVGLPATRELPRSAEIMLPSQFGPRATGQSLPLVEHDGESPSGMHMHVGPGLSGNRGSTEAHFTQPGPNTTDSISARPARVKRPTTHLTDYFCYGVQASDASLTSSPQASSSGTPYPLVNYITCNNFSNRHKAFNITKIIEPRSYQEAVNDPRWCKTMAEEISALEENQTWIIVDLPPEKKPINCKWV